MANISDTRLDSLTGSSRIIPILDDPDSTNGEEQIASTKGMAVDDGGGGGGDKFSGEFNPMDAWLPITESRNGSTFTVAFHLLCSGIGIQVLHIPIAVSLLGWFWGILCLSIAYSWQLYTTWLLVNLHESSPVTGIRYSRFLHLAIVAFGEKLGKWLAIFPTLYLSSGACIIYIIIGGAVMKIFFHSMCGGDPGCTASAPNGALCFLAFACTAILVAQFFPNLDSLGSVTLVGSIAALAYCSLLWIVPLAWGRPNDDVETVAVLLTGSPIRIRNALVGFESLLLAFRGHNLVLEIQGTLPSSSKQPSRKSMWSGVMISYVLIPLCMYPMAIVGYWTYGNKVPFNGGMLGALATLYDNNNTSKLMIGTICLMIIINYICAFQIYAMPTFDNLERIYVTAKNEPCPRWVRSSIKIFYGTLAYTLAVTLPFLPRIGTFVGAIGLPLTLIYPCFMWLAINKPPRFNRMWCLNMFLGYFGTILTFVFLPAALWRLISLGLKANFFKP